MARRKIIQISAAPENDDYYGAIYALADDGTLWKMRGDNRNQWEPVLNIPQGDDYDQKATTQQPQALPPTSVL